MCRRQFGSDVEGVLELLPHREGEVLALQYGLFTGEPQSLTDVAKVLKMSVEGVRKNELSAFRCVLAVCCITYSQIIPRFLSRRGMRCFECPVFCETHSATYILALYVLYSPTFVQCDLSMQIHKILTSRRVLEREKTDNSRHNRPDPP